MADQTNARSRPETEPNASPIAVAEHFYSGALDRIRRFMAVLALRCWSLLAGGSSGCARQLGFAFGCAIAYVNFYWLKRVISGFVDRAAGAQTSQSGRRNRLPLPAALCFDGRRRLCYIDCFTREPEWASCGLIFARRSDRMRSCLRSLRSLARGV